MLNKKFVYILNYFKVNTTAHKSNSRTDSQRQNKKAMLMTAMLVPISKFLLT